MLSPYILARVNAAAEHFDLVVIEGSLRSTVYAWDPIGGGERFTRVTMFTERAVEETPPAEITARMHTLLDQHRPDVVAIPGWSFPEALAMLVWANANRVPVVVMSESTEHDHARNWTREALKRWILGFCSAALVGGPVHKRYLAKLGIGPQQVFLGYDAVDNAYYAGASNTARKEIKSWREKLGLPEHYFLLSNRFVAIKNLDGFLTAYADYRARVGAAAWDVVMLGDGQERGRLERQAEVLGLEGHVHFPGFRQYDALPTYYALAKAFVHVSTVEPWGLVVNEAAACGLPLIVSDRCGCAETLVEHGVNGWRIDPFDLGSITEAMLQMSDRSEAERAGMGRHSLKIVEAWGPQAFGAGMKAAVAYAMDNPAKPAGPVARFALSALARHTPR